VIGRGITAAALGLVAGGCLAADEPDVAVDEQEAVLETTWRLPYIVDICFVLDATNSATQAQMDSIRANVETWTRGDTELRFRWRPNTFVTKLFSGVNYRTNCTQDWVGRFNEELRLYVDTRPQPPDSPTRLPDTYPIPNCSHPDPVGGQAYVDDPNGTRWPVITPDGKWRPIWGLMWSMFPNDSLAELTCLYTTHLNVNGAPNIYVHEIGHAVGLAHEPLHGDQDCLDKHGTGGIKLTNYDRDSVMHYPFTCLDGTTPTRINDATGPSPTDHLAVEMMYPMTLDARIRGNTVHWEAGSLRAYSDWVARGAYVSGPPSEHALRDFRWRVDGALISSEIEPTSAQWAGVAPGRHTVSLEMRDLWGSLHTGSTVIEVMPSQAAYMERAAVAAVF
jgi:hypothetical protein